LVVPTRIVPENIVPKTDKSSKKSEELSRKWKIASKIEGEKITPETEE
jgi:hypothetical protein